MKHIGVSYKQAMLTEHWDAIVIGSGMGGLTTAALLAKRGGKRVLVLERHYTAGGFTHVFTRPGFEWDVGVHYIGQVGEGGALRGAFDEVTDGKLYLTGADVAIGRCEWSAGRRNRDGLVDSGHKGDDRAAHPEEDEAMKTTAEALTWVREQGIALEAAKVGTVPSLAHEIVQGPIKGSWWGHPKGKQIFELASAVHDSGEVVVLKLIDGKNTYVHRALWPALLRVLLDAHWRAPRIAKLKAAGKQLYADVERTGMVEHPDAKAVKEVEAALVALVASHHTDQGHHEKAVMSWARWAKQSGAKADQGALDAALTKLRAAAHGAKVL